MNRLLIMNPRNIRYTLFLNIVLIWRKHIICKINYKLGVYTYIDDSFKILYEQYVY